jgi:dTDP-4-dehydrorhamnose reductase
MKIAVTGSEGRLGSWLVNKFGLTPLQCDITKSDEVEYAINTLSPDVIIHTAALTNVEFCEDNPKEAFDVNVRGTANIVDHFSKGLLIYISTVHIFSGDNISPYKETSKPNPKNHYGFTKWAGEAIASFGTHQTIVVRTSKLFDLAYLATGLNCLQEGKPKEYPTFITRSFIYVPHFIQGIMKLIDLRENAPDIVNVASTNVSSYADFWQAIAGHFNYGTSLVGGRSYDIGGINRPRRGGLDVSLSKRLGLPLYSTLDGILAIKEIM